MGDSESIRTTSRYTSLDGLRGLAAFVVVLHHCFLVSPQLADAVDEGASGPFEPWVWWTTFTPAHLVWAGQEAVFVFFILSGFVLTLPFVRMPRPSWWAYYPKRMIRIYLPVWASLVFALLMAWLVPRVARPEFSKWVNVHDTAPNVLADAYLLGGAGALNSPLWSLQWEMVFSLLLPIYWLAAMRCRRVWLFGVVALVVLVGAAEQTNLAGPVVLPMFGIGALIALQRDVLEGWARRLGHWGWTALVAIAVLLLCSHWMFPQFPAGIAVATIGSVLLVFAFIGCRPVIALGRNSLIHWLGVRSFSLYLVHEPIVVSVGFALRITNPFQAALIAVPLSLLAAEVFFRLVEQPSHRLAQAAGRAATERGRREKVSIAGP